MNTKHLFHKAAMFAAFLAVTSIVTAPALAQTTKPARTTKTASARTYECKECNLKFTTAEAKKKGFKCACGCTLTPIKTAKKTDHKKKG